MKLASWKESFRKRMRHKEKVKNKKDNSRQAENLRMALKIKS